MEYCKSLSLFITNSFNYIITIVKLKEDNYSELQNERDLEENKIIKSKSAPQLISLKNNKKIVTKNKDKTHKLNYRANNYTNKILIELEDGTFGFGTQLFYDKQLLDKKEV
jgi:hypothetical protein